MVSSTSNARIKNVLKLLKSGKERKKQGTFVVEGVRMFQEIPKEQLVETFVTKEFEESHKEMLASYEYELVSTGVMKEMSETVTPQGVLCVVRMNEFCLGDILSKGKCVLFLENLQDPGNLGTIMRTAEASGTAGVIMSNDTVDIYNPKVVRSTMGAIFRVPFCYVEDKKETISILHKDGFETYAAHLKGNTMYQCDFKGKSCFLIGNEGNGLTDETTMLASKRILIPMCGKAESLNASMAAGILMYEAKRQRDCQ